MELVIAEDIAHTITDEEEEVLDELRQAKYVYCPGCDFMHTSASVRRSADGVLSVELDEPDGMPNEE
jgi:hypothetical protein